MATCVDRGFEATRGFDISLKAARRIDRARPDVLFVVVGEGRVVHGGDAKRIGGESFRDYAPAQGDDDPSKSLFTGAVPPEELARILSLGDVHLDLTVPFVLSRSLFDAPACGGTVVASDTGPVRELVAHVFRPGGSLPPGRNDPGDCPLPRPARGPGNHGAPTVRADT